mmetsp:Transcript_96780/g.269104  ORF Transcript_96780/g.269104 Transcript_96780/m.269104 type:complete len:420 (+) Transcript_96780:38-1297(+)
MHACARSMTGSQLGHRKRAAAQDAGRCPSPGRWEGTCLARRGDTREPTPIVWWPLPPSEAHQLAQPHPIRLCGQARLELLLLAGQGFRDRPTRLPRELGPDAGALRLGDLLHQTPASGHEHADEVARQRPVGLQWHPPEDEVHSLCDGRVANAAICGGSDSAKAALPAYERHGGANRPVAPASLDLLQSSHLVVASADPCRRERGARSCEHAPVGLTHLRLHLRHHLLHHAGVDPGAQLGRSLPDVHDLVAVHDTQLALPRALAHEHKAAAAARARRDRQDGVRFVEATLAARALNGAHSPDLLTILTPWPDGPERLCLRSAPAHAVRQRGHDHHVPEEPPSGADVGQAPRAPQQEDVPRRQELHGRAALQSSLQWLQHWRRAARTRRVGPQQRGQAPRIRRRGTTQLGGCSRCLRRLP